MAEFGYQDRFNYDIHRPDLDLIERKRRQQLRYESIFSNNEVLYNFSMPKKLQIYLSDNNYNFYRESNVEIRDLEAKLRQARINKQVIKSISLHSAFSINIHNHRHYTCLIFVRCLTDQDEYVIRQPSKSNKRSCHRHYRKNRRQQSQNISRH